MKILVYFFFIKIITQISSTSINQQDKYKTKKGSQSPFAIDYQLETLNLTYT
jgi:hypothetical protein